MLGERRRGQVAVHSSDAGPDRRKDPHGRRLAAERANAIEAALGALVSENSFTENREGGNRVGRMLRDLFLHPDLVCEVAKSTRFADHLVFATRAAGRPVVLVGTSIPFSPGHFERLSP